MSEMPARRGWLAEHRWGVVGAALLVLAAGTSALAVFVFLNRRNLREHSHADLTPAGLFADLRSLVEQGGSDHEARFKAAAEALGALRNDVQASVSAATADVDAKIQRAAPQLDAREEVRALRTQTVKALAEFETRLEGWRVKSEDATQTLDERWSARLDSMERSLDELRRATVVGTSGDQGPRVQRASGASPVTVEIRQTLGEFERYAKGRFADREDLADLRQVVERQLGDLITRIKKLETNRSSEALVRPAVMPIQGTNLSNDGTTRMPEVPEDGYTISPPRMMV